MTTHDTPKKRTVWDWILLFPLLFLSVTAIAGGGTLISSPTGQKMRMPTAWLRGTPFDSYLVPGYILAIAVGGSAFLSVIFLLANPRIGRRSALAAGAVLAGWIAGQWVLLPVSSWLQSAYFGLACLIVALAAGTIVRERAG